MTPLVDTPFQLISGSFHVNQGVLCCEHAVLEGGGGATGLLNKEGEQQASWFSKQQAVEFPQVLTIVYYNNSIPIKHQTFVDTSFNLISYLLVSFFHLKLEAQGV